MHVHTEGAGFPFYTLSCLYFLLIFLGFTSYLLASVWDVEGCDKTSIFDNLGLRTVAEAAVKCHYLSAATCKQCSGLENILHWHWDGELQYVCISVSHNGKKMCAATAAVVLEDRCSWMEEQLWRLTKFTIAQGYITLTPFKLYSQPSCPRIFSCFHTKRPEYLILQRHSPFRSSFNSIVWCFQRSQRNPSQPLPEHEEV